jgi:hypothetical protein
VAVAAGRSPVVIVGVVGAINLVANGIIPTVQKSNDFGRIYAAYGGALVAASLLRGWAIDPRSLADPAGLTALAKPMTRPGASADVGEPPDSRLPATAAEPALHILEGKAMLRGPCFKLRDINWIG